MKSYSNLRIPTGWLVIFLPLTAGVPLLSHAQISSACLSGSSAARLVQEATQQQNPTESRVTAYQQVMKLCPDEASLYVGLTTLLIKAQRTGEALIWTRRGLSRWPAQADLGRNLGVALLAQGHPQQALEVLEKLPPGPETDFELGMTYRALGQHEMARKTLSAAYREGQRDPYILYAIIQQDRAIGDKDAGLKDFATLDHDFPGSAWIHLLVGDAYADRHDPDGARREYSAAIAAEPSMPVAHFDLGRLAFDRGDYSQAEADFGAELRLNPTFGEAHLYLGETLLRQGNNAEAIEPLREAIAYSPELSLAYQALATALDSSGQTTEALGILKEGAQRFPREGAFPGQEARILRRLGRLSEASQAAQSAEDLSRRNNPLHPPAGSTSSQPADARTEPEKPAKTNLHTETTPPSTETSPQDAASWVTLGRRQQKAGDEVSAIHSFLQAQQLEPKSPLPVYSIGMSFFLLGIDSGVDEYYERAQRHFKAALELDPRYDRAVFMLGVIDVVRSIFPEGRKYLEQAIGLVPENPYYHLQYGMLLSRLGEDQKAVDEMKKAEQLDPSNPRCHLGLGEIYARQADYPSARTELEKAVQLDPNLAVASYTLGGVYHHLGLNREAEKAYAAFQQAKEKQSEAESDPVAKAIQGNGKQ